MVDTAFQYYLIENLGPSILDHWEMVEECIVSKPLHNRCMLHEIAGAMDIVFVERGAIKIYEQSGAERITLFLLTERSGFVNAWSESNREGEQLVVEPEVESKLFILPYQRLMAASRVEPQFYMMLLKFVQAFVIRQQELRRIFLTNNAGGRYREMINRYPDYFRFFRVKDLASFIGVTPVSLSRLRKQF